MKKLHLALTVGLMSLTLSGLSASAVDGLTTIKQWREKIGQISQAHEKMQQRAADLPETMKDARDTIQTLSAQKAAAQLYIEVRDAMQQLAAKKDSNIRAALKTRGVVNKTFVNGKEVGDSLRFLLNAAKDAHAFISKHYSEKQRSLLMAIKGFLSKHQNDTHRTLKQHSTPQAAQDFKRNIIGHFKKLK